MGVAQVPVLTPGSLVLFPAMRCLVHLTSIEALAAVRAASEPIGGGWIAIFAARPDIGHNRVGTLARVEEPSKVGCCDRWTVSVDGLQRVQARAFLPGGAFLQVRCEPLPEVPEDPLRFLCLADAITEAVRQMAGLFPRCRHTTTTLARVRDGVRPSDLPGVVQDLLLALPIDDRQALLETDPLSTRLDRTLGALHGLIAESRRALGLEPKSLH